MSLKRALRRAVEKHGGNKRARRWDAGEGGNRNDGECRPAHLLLGEAAENLATDYLSNKGFTIIGRNVRSGGGEIDIIAKEGDELVFVEVRGRSVGIIMPAETTVGRDKLTKLIRAARTWVESRRFEGFWRIDLVAVSYDEGKEPLLKHIRNITEVMT